MNRLQTKKGIKFNQSTVNFALLTAVFLSVFSTNTFANRPMMEDPDSANAVDATAEPEAPSSVDIMMQQQPRQTTTGDVLQLPPKEMQLGETIKIQLLDFPRRGMTMDKVQHEYGQPIAISDTVGKPPITRWTYHDRVVYFEYSTVLHVVAR